MWDRTDNEWLRVDMLAHRWRSDAPVEPPPLAEADDPLQWCARLCALSRARFGDGAAITRVIVELGRLTTQRFAPAGDADDGDPAALDARIETLIAQVEDLVDAAALARRR
jgi:hypothetical protein